ncbi:glycerophosphodiester phosphodiesterase [Roseateles aquatilis]|uniref:glycerophosphodiester phosphodiesterase n=1 Tax=Roseateles aquatilis TaxID=431061 RepID=A0A246JMG9_9BURK|nr:glycerophosphodiester phosphodiesterase [Roseateles aquatilis]OWQ93817.1 glycerophosphodiester phosphodiesterase [Roseateles aquatilis]
MKLLRNILLSATTLAMAATVTAAVVLPMSAFAHDASQARSREPLLIAHRGASGYVPEHTLAAYWLAIEQGADYVEPDLVLTKDGVLVARHENAIAILNADGSVREATTDVAERPEFASRKTTKTIDGTAVTGWFTEDFTLAELKTLRARERIPQIRPANARFNDMFEIPTFEEVLQLVQQANERRREAARRNDGRDDRHGHGGHGNGKPKPIGVYPETKHPSYFAGIGKPLEEPLVRLLDRYGYRGADAPVFIQSFEVGNLRKLRRMTRVPLVQLLNGSGRPYDFVLSGDPRGYADLAKPAGLAEISGYAQGIGANTNLMIPLVAGRLGTPTTLVRDAHAAGLIVHGWTFRAENAFLPDDFDSSADPTAHGDLAGQIHAFLKLGMDGLFSDQSFLARKAIDAYRAKP